MADRPYKGAKFWPLSQYGGCRPRAELLGLLVAVLSAPPKTFCGVNKLDNQQCGTVSSLVKIVGYLTKKPDSTHLRNLAYGWAVWNLRARAGSGIGQMDTTTSTENEALADQRKGCWGPSAEWHGALDGGSHSTEPGYQIFALATATFGKSPYYAPQTNKHNIRHPPE